MNLSNRIKQFGFLLKEAFLHFINDNGLKLSAALSYYTIFSLPPLLIIIITLSGIFFGAEAVTGQLFWQIKGLVGSEAALQIQDAIKNVNLSKDNTIATIIGIVVLIIGASGVFAEIQDSLNFIWGLEAKPKRGFFKFIKNRVMSFSMIGSVGFLLMVGLVVNSLLDILNNRITTYFSVETVYLFYAINIITVFLIIALLFTVIFKHLPDGKLKWKDCIIGASFTSLLFMLGKFAIGFYLGSSAMASIYGAAGSVIVILGWVYYSAIILYFGAEFTKVYAWHHGYKIVPYSYSVKIVKQDIMSDQK